MRQEFADREARLQREIADLHRQLQALGRVDPLALASGGIVRRATLAMVGESGPEAVVPLGRGGLSNITLNFNLYGNIDNESTAREMVRKVKDILQEELRRGISW